ncbi:MAG: PilZ domain-containing protein, partial [Desulfobacterales bacterium]
RSGLFIITKTRLSIGEIITVAIPYENDKLIKCRGKIIRKDKDGFGIELIRKRSKANLRIIK